MGDEYLPFVYQSELSPGSFMLENMIIFKKVASPENQAAKFYFSAVAPTQQKQYRGPHPYSMYSTHLRGGGGIKLSVKLMCVATLVWKVPLILKFLLIFFIEIY